jgi:MFS family permease
VIGGLVVSHFSWRWLFFFNLPLAAFAAWRLLLLPQGEKHPAPAAGVDLAGHLLFAVGALSTLFWLTSGGHRFAWSSPTSFALAATGAAALTALYFNERRRPAPFLPIDLLHKRTIGLSALLIAFFAACLFAVIFFLPIYLQLGHSVSAQASGLLLLPVTAGMVTAAMISSRRLARTGKPHWIPVVGMSVSSAALLMLALLPPTMPLVIVLGFFAGVGFGTVMPTSQMTMQCEAGRAKLGAVTAIAGLARSTGGAAGAALFGAVVFSTIADGGVVQAFHHGFLFAAALAALGAFTASRIPHITLWHSAAPKNAG